jgi:hypothetical protein
MLKPYVTPFEGSVADPEKCAIVRSVLSGAAPPIAVKLGFS